MSHSDLAAASGLSRAWVAKLSKRRSWKGVPIDVVVRFSAACGVNLTNPRRAREFLHRAKKEHVVRATPQQQRFFAEIFRRGSAVRDSKTSEATQSA